MIFEDLMLQIKRAAHLDFGSIFSRSIDLFKRVWVQGCVTLLLTVLVMLPFYIILYIPLIAAGITDPELMQSENIPPEVMLPMLILFPIFMLAIMVITFLFNAAFLRICRQKDFNETGSESYFYYFKRPYFGKAIVLSFIILGFGLVGIAACGVGLFYVMVPISIFPAFFAFNEEMSPIEIVKASFAIGNKNWLTIFGLIFLTGLLAQLGTVLCIVGVFFTAMISKVPAYFIHKDSVGHTVVQ